MLDIAQRQEDTATLVAAHRVFGTSSFWRGRFEPAQTHLERALSLYDPIQHRQLGVIDMVDTRVLGLDFMSLALLPLGCPMQAQQRSEQALVEAERTSSLVTLAIVLQHGCLFHQLCQNRQAVRERAEALLSLASEQGFPFWLAHGTFFRSWALAGQIHPEQGIAQIRQGLDAVKATGSELFLPYYSALLAEAYGKAGQGGKALNLFTDAIGRIESTGERWCEAELHRLKGELLLVISGQDQAAAEDSFRQALQIAHRQNAQLWELRAGISLSRLLLERGEDAEARDLLAPIYSRFTEGFDAADLKEAKALLEAGVALK